MTSRSRDKWLLPVVQAMQFQRGHKYGEGFPFYIEPLLFEATTLAFDMNRSKAKAKSRVFPDAVLHQFPFFVSDG